MYLLFAFAPAIFLHELRTEDREEHSYRISFHASGAVFVYHVLGMLWEIYGT